MLFSEILFVFMQKSCGFVFVCSINIYQDQWCSYFIMCKNHVGCLSRKDFPWLGSLQSFSLSKSQSAQESLFFFFFPLNHFIEEWLTCKKPYIFSVCNSMSIHSWIITTIKATNNFNIFQSLLPHPLLLLLLLLFVRPLNTNLSF